MYERLTAKLREKPTHMCNDAKTMWDAADAIEELSQIAAHHEQKAKDYWQEACEYREQIAHLVKEQAALFEPALKSLELSKRPYVLEAPQPRWIPVEERLPNENDRYLTVSVEPWFGTTVVDTMRWSGVWMYDGRQTAATVTHWMPLPQPPKEET